MTVFFASQDDPCHIMGKCDGLCRNGTARNRPRGSAVACWRTQLRPEGVAGPTRPFGPLAWEARSGPQDASTGPANASPRELGPDTPAGRLFRSTTTLVLRLSLSFGVLLCLVAAVGGKVGNLTGAVAPVALTSNGEISYFSTDIAS